MAELMKIVTNAEDVSHTVNRMAAHFEAAPDDDPAKQAMIEFGEIDAARDTITEKSWVEGDCLIVRLKLSPALQSIADMVSD